MAAYACNLNPEEIEKKRGEGAGLTGQPVLPGSVRACLKKLMCWLMRNSHSLPVPHADAPKDTGRCTLIHTNMHTVRVH